MPLVGNKNCRRMIHHSVVLIISSASSHSDCSEYSECDYSSDHIGTEVLITRRSLNNRPPPTDNSFGIERFSHYRFHSTILVFEFAFKA